VESSTIIERVKQQVKGLSRYLEDEDYASAIEDACRETGWTLPTTSDFKTQWIIKRTKRHLFEYLQTEQAYKFKFEQINLQNRFEHLSKLIERFDREFRQAMLENIQEFSGVDVNKIFGTYVHAGFSYDSVGTDTTYDDDNLVKTLPTE